jgi:error-prone DNA polymerase
MTALERLRADYSGQGLTTGPHPMGYLRPQLQGEVQVSDLAQLTDGQLLVISGQVICRQRPSTAKGHCFLSLEDETGIGNVFVPSKLFERQRLLIVQEPFLRIRGRLQRVDDVTTVFAFHVERVEQEIGAVASSHDFH